MIRRHRYLIAYLFFVVVLLAGMVRLELVARDGAEAHEALCELRSDLERRADSLIAFIEAHPQGIPGITRIVLERSLSNQRQTIASLSDLECEQLPKGAER